MLGTFVVMLGYGILSPVLPNYARSFGVGYDSIGLLISSFAFARLLSDPFVGRYIDRYGERAMSTLGAVWVGVVVVRGGVRPHVPAARAVPSARRRRLGAVLRVAALVPAAVDPVTTDRTRDERVLRVVQHRLHRGRPARRADGEVVRPGEPALHLRGRVLRRGRAVLADDPQPRTPRVRGPTRRHPPAAVEPRVRDRARRERRLPVDDRRDLQHAGPAVRDERPGRAHDRRRGDRARDRHGDRARGAVPGGPRDRSARPPRRADPGARRASR